MTETNPVVPIIKLRNELERILKDIDFEIAKNTKADDIEGLFGSLKIRLNIQLGILKDSATEAYLISSEWNEKRRTQSY